MDDKFSVEVHLAAQVFLQSKVEGSTVADVVASSPDCGLSDEKALEYESALDALGFYRHGETTIDEIIKQATSVYLSRRKPRPQPELDFCVRISNAILEHVATKASWRELAAKHKVHRVTLAKYYEALKHCVDRLSDPNLLLARVRTASKQFAATLGRNNRYFSPGEETMLVGFLRMYEKESIAMDKTSFLDFVRSFLEKRCAKLKRNPPSSLRGWYYSFMKRNASRLTIRSAQAASYSRVMAQDSKILHQWVQQVQQFEAELIGEGRLPRTGFEPFQILNFDEANFNPQGKPGRVLVSPENRDVNIAMSSDRTPFHVTYGCLSSAAGDIFAVQVIHAHPKEQLNNSNTEGLFQYDENLQLLDDGLHLFASATSNGWQTASTFMGFLNHVLATLDDVRQTDSRCNADTVFQLFLDNHFSRWVDKKVAADLYEECIARGLYVSFLPAHLSHVLQPNDRALHAHLKAVYNDLLSQHLEEERKQGLRPIYSRISKSTFNAVIMKTMRKVATDPESRKKTADGFRKAGLLPCADRSGFEPMEYPNWFSVEDALAPDDKPSEPQLEETELGSEQSDAGLDDHAGEASEIDEHSTVTELVVPESPVQLTSTTPVLGVDVFEAAPEDASGPRTPIIDPSTSIHDILLMYLRDRHGLFCEYAPKRLAVEDRYSRLAGRISEGSVSIFGTPELLTHEMERWAQIPRPVPKYKKRRISWSVAGCANPRRMHSELKKRIHEDDAAALEKRRKALLRYQEQETFSLFCEEVGFDLRSGEHSEAELLDISDSYAGAIKDRRRKEELLAKVGEKRQSAPCARAPTDSYESTAKSTASTAIGKQRKRKSNQHVTLEPSRTQSSTQAHGLERQEIETMEQVVSTSHESESERPNVTKRQRKPTKLQDFVTA